MIDRMIAIVISERQEKKRGKKGEKARGRRKAGGNQLSTQHSGQ